MSMTDTEARLFTGGGLAWREPAATESPAATGSALVSPFAGGFSGTAEYDAGPSATEALMNELEDEGFREAVESLVDEVAGRHLMAAERWPDDQQSEAVAEAEATSFVEGLADSVDRGLSELELRYENRRIDSLTADEIDSVLGEYARDPDSLSEQLFGGLVKKAFNVAKSVAKGAVAGLSRLVPLGPVFGVLRKLVRPLLKRVLDKAINRLPPALRAPATQLAAKLGLSEAEEPTEAGQDLTEEFDRQYAELLLAPSEADQAELLLELEQDTSGRAESPITTLDQAREVLTHQLAEAEPGRPPTEQLEQFIPAVMAAMPLIRTGVRIIGRARIKNFLASQLANLIQGYIGPQAARALAPQVADTGLRLLSLEGESPELLGAEALVSTLEEAVTRVVGLPPEAFEEPLRLEAEVQEALASAAVHHLPAELLRDDLAGYDTEAGTGPWITMPRRTRHRRYRRSARRYDVQITRPQASGVELPGPETLEDRLLEAGVSAWPVSAEVELFEAMVGTQAGHLAAGEGADASPAEFEELSPVNAALLLGRPALGTRYVPGGPVTRRFFRLVVPGRKVVRRRHRVYLRLRAQGPQPELRVHVRIGERLAGQIATMLSRNNQTEVVALFGRLLGPRVQEHVASRLTALLSRAKSGSATRGRELAGQVLEQVKTQLAKELATSQEALSAAAKDPKPGLTLTFAFPFADTAALATGEPGAPSLTIRPGAHND
ncbi:hypothetical protein EV644_104195 [Kribbella orskensis]|uniref:Uncharacterized protein n=1 Tax=Kribbella orskensis TaxID=2512216 RepID=A0ABY2BMN8_9ACTN|nr:MULTISPECIES: hypothetical protein [Kribbella]TCN41813.1 hypothetical protein EV642_103195 [Kribbella sp. VKM Ac-2500]TCO25691.1 hypothetical protein EV644_104195 [Kribbella orskensis]